MGLSHGGITGWPGFVLVMRKLVGDAVLPWLPALYAAAAALPGVKVPAFGAEEVGEFRAAVAGT